MKVFISWSGAETREIAEFRHRWLHDVIQTLQPWMSKADIESGARWEAELSVQLETTDGGIRILTKNQLAPG